MTGGASPQFAPVPPEPEPEIPGFLQRLRRLGEKLRAWIVALYERANRRFVDLTSHSGVRKWMRRAVLLGAGLIVLSSLLFAAFFAWIDSRIVPADSVVATTWIPQGWNSHDRQTYYYTPQGAFVKDVRYDWFQNLERPWSKDRFSDPKYLRSYGFLVDPAPPESRPDLVPVVGLTRRYDAIRGESFLDLTCAACHTGEIHAMRNGTRVAVRIDGGQAMHDITSDRMGGFGSDLLASLSATYLNPFKFQRFAKNVLGESNTSEARKTLRTNLGTVAAAILKQAIIDKRFYKHQEGFGRTDAIARISNNVFATHLEAANYISGDAPVNFPPVWSIWKFDWVQYTGSVRQPMARNVGESLGSGATYYILDPYGRPVSREDQFNASVEINGLDKIENTLRKLQPPSWPEEVLGAVNRPLAEQGRQLFQKHCQHCHGPQAADAVRMKMESPLKDPAKGDEHWVMTLLPTGDIGTDPQAARNFYATRLDLSKSGITLDELRKQLRPTFEADYQRRIEYLKTRLAAPGMAAPSCAETAKTLQAKLEELTKETLHQYIDTQLANVDLSRVAIGQGLNYIVTMIRAQSYEAMGLPPGDPKQAVLDGFGQLDTPQVVQSYKARPLAGIWATPPFLHNGSVPTLYHMLVPANQRPSKFWVRSRLLDTRHVGLTSDANEPGAFLFDTAVVGNSNIGHEFRAGYRPWKPGNPPSNGVIGPELTDAERWAIVEYLKIHRDENTTLPYRDPDVCNAVSAVGGN
jgi:hypothetical protein